MAYEIQKGDRERIEFLEEENRRLRTLLRPENYLFIPVEWDLSPLSKKILLQLFIAPCGQRSMEELMQLIDPSSEARDISIRTSVWTIRKKLKSKGIMVENIWGFGYRLPRRSIEIIRREATIAPRYALGLPPFVRPEHFRTLEDGAMGRFFVIG